MMKKAFTTVFVLFLGVQLFAQSAVNPNETVRKIWCEMSNITPNVKEFKEYCTQLMEVYPSPQEIAKHEITTKIFMTKIRGVIKRGTEWDKLTPAKRTETAKHAIQLVDDFLGWKEIEDYKQPEGFQRKSMGQYEECEQKELKYETVEACIADCDYIYVDCVTGDGKDNTTVAFWCVLNRVACTLECN